VNPLSEGRNHRRDVERAGGESNDGQGKGRKEERKRRGGRTEEMIQRGESRLMERWT
jgi:hypothetical protein